MILRERTPEPPPHKRGLIGPEHIQQWRRRDAMLAALLSWAAERGYKIRQRQRKGPAR
jgi:hypothetical protein